MAIETSVEVRRPLVVANEACAGNAFVAGIRTRTGEGVEHVTTTTGRAGCRTRRRAGGGATS